MRTRYAENDGTVARARRLRRESTPPERVLWAALRTSAIDGFKFRRQQRLGPYFADFACMSARLVLELDGDGHAHRIAYDAGRTAFLEREGYRVLRFTNREVLNNLEGVLFAIRAALLPSPSQASGLGPSLSPEGRGL